MKLGGELLVERGSGNCVVWWRLKDWIRVKTVKWGAGGYDTEPWWWLESVLEQSSVIGQKI